MTADHFEIVEELPNDYVVLHLEDAASEKE